MAARVIGVVDPARARDAARGILAGRRYRGSPVPRPLHGVLRWIGDRITPITHWIGDRFSWLPQWSQPYVGAFGVAVAATAIVIAVIAIVRARARNRATRDADRGESARGLPVDDAVALEAAAAEAETRGDLALAVRLRFRAGLLRLDRDAHAINYKPSISTALVRDELGSPTFDELADRFEGITYGAEAAETTDTAAARREWPRVVAAARRK